MTAYLTAEEFGSLTGRTADEETERRLRQASDQIDVLTFQRIHSIGWEKLSLMQQKLIKAVCAEHTAFLLDYGETLENPLSSYGIGGVSMSWNKEAVVTQNGVTMLPSLYAQLVQTGLCCRALRR